MLKKPTSTTFKFILDNQQLLSNLDNLKLNDYNRFLKIGQIGKQIQLLAKQENIKALEDLCQKHYVDIQFMKLEIQDAFVSALHLRNQQVVKYFLDHGIQIGVVQEGCVLEVCYSLEYLRHDPPYQLLKLLLQYGGNARYAGGENSDTPMHVASKYGCVQFLKLLIQYGADINAVNDERMTPLGCAIANKQTKAIYLLKSQKANEKWNS